MEDAQTFRFFDLPPEIRNIVYKLVFESYSAHVSLVHADVKRPAVLSANHQLYAEAISVFYSCSDFRFSKLQSGLAWLQKNAPKFQRMVASFTCQPGWFRDPQDCKTDTTWYVGTIRSRLEKSHIVWPIGVVKLSLQRRLFGSVTFVEQEDGTVKRL